MRAQGREPGRWASEDLPKAGPRGTPAGRLGPKQGGWGLLGSSWDPKTGSEAAPAPERQDQRGTRQHLWRLQGEVEMVPAGGWAMGESAAPHCSSLVLPGPCLT